MYEITDRKLVVIIEANDCGDDLLSPVVIPLLRKYAQMLEEGIAGSSGYDVFEEGGNKLIAIGTTTGTKIPYDPGEAFNAGKKL